MLWEHIARQSSADINGSVSSVRYLEEAADSSYRSQVRLAIQSARMSATTVFTS